MAKLGRPIKPDAKRDGVNIRLTKEESDMLRELSKKTGKTRTDIMVAGLKRIYRERGG